MDDVQFFFDRIKDDVCLHISQMSQTCWKDTFEKCEIYLFSFIKYSSLIIRKFGQPNLDIKVENYPQNRENEIVFYEVYWLKL